MNCQVYAEYCEDGYSVNDGFRNFLIIMGILSTGISFSIILNAFVFYNDSTFSEKEEEQEEGEEGEEEESDFFTKYNIKEANDFNKDKDSIEESVVVENTPNGVVLMKYCVDSEAFLYWSEFNRITYGELQTVARKFVSVFNCKQLYKITDLDNEEKKHESDAEETEEPTEETEEPSEETEEPSDETEEPTEEKPKSVFADLKANKKIAEAKEKSKSLDSETFQTNRYIRVGSFNDFKYNMNEKSKKNQEKEVSYSLFRTMKL